MKSMIVTDKRNTYNTWKGKALWKRCIALILALCLMGSNLLPINQPVIAEAAVNQTRIHFIAINDNNDAILLENNGMFGMVDSGEDTDGPENPTNGIVPKGQGYEKEVVNYLKKAGVKEDGSNFLFYIGTHPHSDHVGSADTVIRTFKPKRVYTPEYDDSFISDRNALWDNQKVYDDMLAAAKDVGATLIQNFNTDAPVDPVPTTIKGTIAWNDNNNADKLRPKSISISLYHKDAPQKPITSANCKVDQNASETNYTLYPPKRGEDGKDINYKNGQYYIEITATDGSGIIFGTEPEAAEDGYQMLPGTNPFFVECIHNPWVTVEVNGQIAWDASIDPSELPENITLALKRGIAPSETEEPDWDSIAILEDSQITVTPESLSDGTDKWEFSFKIKETSAEHAKKYMYRAVIADEASPYIDKSFTKNEDKTYTLTIGLKDSTVSENEPDAVASFFLSDDDFLVSDTQADSQPQETTTFSLENNSSQTANEQFEPQSDDLPQVPVAPEDEVSMSDLPLLGYNYTPSIPSTSYSERSGSQGYESSYQKSQESYTANPIFSLGNATIQIMNYETEYKKPQTPVEDANFFSFGVLITAADGKKAFLSGDINNFPTETGNPAEATDESRLAASDELKNGVDVLKISHHGAYGSNTPGYLKTLKPKIAVLTGSFNHVCDLGTNDHMGGTFSSLKKLLNENKTKLYATTWYSHSREALIVNLDNSSVEGAKENHFAYSSYQKDGFYLKDGAISSYKGWYHNIKNGWDEGSGMDGSYFYFENSPYPSKDKWIYVNNNYYHVNEYGQMETGWQLINGSWYYLTPNDNDSKGVMQTGWVHDGKNWYYCDSDGRMQTGWLHVDGYWYYADADNSPAGALAQGWKVLGGEWYYFNPSSEHAGRMMTGWVEHNGSWYYCNDGIVDPSKKYGAMLTGEFQIGGQTYYFDPSSGKKIDLQIEPGWRHNSKGWWYQNADGSYPVNTFQKINGDTYYFDSNGYIIFGWNWIGDSCYYFNASGVMQTGWIGDSYCDPATGKWIPGFSQTEWVQDSRGWWLKHSNGSYPVNQWEMVNGVWYHFNGSGYMDTGWIVAGNAWYFLNSNGAMQTGWIYQGGVWYYMNESGAMVTGWLLLDGIWYYLEPSSGAMATGWKLLGNSWYYMSPNGAMLPQGWQLVDGIWYYMDANGAIQTGWLNLNNTWYYLTGSGAMATGWLDLGNWYYLNPNGDMATGWQLLGGSWYYLNPNGDMATGWIQLSDAWYYLQPSGAMASNTQIGNYYVDGNGRWIA